MTRLDTIVLRQRRVLLRDLLFAAFVALTAAASVTSVIQG